MIRTLPELIDRSLELFQDVPDGYMTGDKFHDFFVTDIADSLAAIDAPVKNFPGLLFIWPYGDIKSIHSKTPIFSPVNNIATIPHFLDSQSIDIILINSEQNIIGAEAFYLQPIDNNNAEIHFYGEFPQLKFYKFLIVNK